MGSSNDRKYPGGKMAIGGFPRDDKSKNIGDQTLPSDSEVLSQFPLSFGQRSLWFIQQFDPENAAHNIVYGVHMLGDTDIGALEKSFQTVVDHNPAFRTSFSTGKGEPFQQVHAHAVIKVDFTDAQDWDDETLDTKLRDVMFCPFDLTKAPLLRVTVIRRTLHDHLVILSIHHIVTDMWSVALLLSQVSKNYKMYLQGEEPPFKKPRATYADHVQWQEDMLAGEEGQGHFQYWQEKLAGELPVLNLVTEKIRPPYQTDRGKSTFMRIDSALRDGLKQVADAQGANIHDLCLAAFKVLLYRYTGLEDIIIGYPKFGRTRQMAKVMGYFVNPVALRSDLSGNPTFADFLQQVKTTLREASAHDAIPFLMLVEKLEPNRALSHSPIFQVMFTWQKTTRIVEQDSMTGMALGDEGTDFHLGYFHMEPISLPYRAVPFDLTLLMAEAGKELGATIEYNMALFEEPTILRMMQHYRMLLEGIVRDPLQPIANIPMLTAEEEEQILTGWTPSLEEKPLALLVEQFAAQVARTPQAPALRVGEQTFTYAELDVLSDRVAGSLSNEGLQPEDIVGVCTRRTAGMVITLWGVLKAGGTILYLDPHLPADRLAFMIDDSKLRFLVNGAGCLTEADCDVLSLESLLAGETAQTKVLKGIQTDRLAYVIYTSGSTGTPKGVMVDHGSIALHVAAMRRHYELNENDRFLQFASLSFDAALEQVFCTLTSGACLVLRDDAIWEPLELLEKMKQYGLTILNLPPAYWHQVAQVWAQQKLPDLPLRLVIIGGDVFHLETLRMWGQTRFRDVRLLNAYGPTETTITSVMYEVPPDYLERYEGRPVPIGQALPGRTAYILNAYSQLVPVGVPGELYIGGPCLARGYLHRPELTEERFVPDPFSKEEGARMYRTGDLVMRFSDGSIAFKGRIDQQVKVRGFRIELGEIEAALNSHPEVKDVVVLAKEMPQAEKQIHAYLVPAHGAVLTIRELRMHLRKTMPEYFLPSGYAFLDALPLTSTGKVDRQALLRMEVQQAAASGLYVAPSTEIERELVAMWQEVMGIERVGVHDDFFELGGHSLIATQLVARIRDAFQFSLPLVALFETPTVAEIAGLITEHLLAKEADDELAGLLDELEGMSEEEVQQMLTDEVQD
jgi:amino acid adenylation domain-containing protein